jgi:hypothetical protein
MDPTWPENEPGGQSEQIFEAVSFLKVPGKQASHLPSTVLPKPRLHTQLSSSALPAGESELSGHVRQAAKLVLPGVVRNLPLSHNSQEDMPEFDAYVPG